MLLCLSKIQNIRPNYNYPLLFNFADADGVPTSDMNAKSYYLVNSFADNCMKKKEKMRPGGGELAFLTFHLDPPLPITGKSESAPLKPYCIVVGCAPRDGRCARRRISTCWAPSPGRMPPLSPGATPSTRRRMEGSASPASTTSNRYVLVGLSPR